MGTPCTDKDEDLFAANTTVIIGDGKMAKFWESSWMNGVRPKGIARKIFEISKKKACVIFEILLGLQDDPNNVASSPLF